MKDIEKVEKLFFYYMENKDEMPPLMKKEYDLYKKDEGYHPNFHLIVEELTKLTT